PAGAERQRPGAWRLRHRGGRHHPRRFPRAREPRLQRISGLRRLDAARGRVPPGESLAVPQLLTPRSMGIFTKLSTVVRSNINDLIARAENPEKMLDQIILDMREELTKAKQEVAVAIADEPKLKAQAE